MGLPLLGRQAGGSWLCFLRCSAFWKLPEFSGGGGMWLRGECDWDLPHCPRLHRSWLQLSSGACCQLWPAQWLLLVLAAPWLWP